MKFKELFYGLAASSLLALAMPVAADETMPYHGLSEQERQQVRDRWSGMSPEERAEVRRKADEYWGGLSDEERAAKREELRKYHGKRSRAQSDTAHGEWHDMTPEERQAHREEMRKRWEAMTPEERQAHRGMMRAPPADSAKAGEFGKDKAEGRSKEKDRKD